MTTAPSTARTVASRYLTFGLAEECYGIDITSVQEIIRLVPVTRVPRLPEYVAGVVNLRGRIIPVVDLRLAFGMPRVDTTELACIIVVSVARSDGRTTVMGMIVDEVDEVAVFSEDDVEPTPRFGVDVDTSFISGVARTGDRVVLLLDIDTALVDVPQEDEEAATQAMGIGV